MSKGVYTRLFALLVALFVGLSLQAQAQQKNEVDLLSVRPLRPLSVLPSGSNFVAPSQNLNFGSSLALGAEYDRRLNSGNTAFYVGVDFLASPLDVKLNQPPIRTRPEFALES